MNLYVWLRAELYVPLLTKEVLINQLRQQHRGISKDSLSPNERGEIKVMQEK